MINFVERIDLTASELNPEPKAIQKTLLISCEANGTVSQFYIEDNSRTGAKNGKRAIEYDLYEYTSWCEPMTPLTTQRVASIGVKNFPGVGSIAFYNLLDEARSGILSPVFVEGQRFTRPQLEEVLIENQQVKVKMKAPSSIDYEAYRFIMRNDEGVFEYVTYENETTFNTPSIAGTYDCHCVGYKGEGEAVSLESNIITVEVTEAEITKDTSLTRDIYVKKATLTPEGYIKLTLTTDEDVILNVGMATKQEVKTDIQEAIYDSWEAEY